MKMKGREKCSRKGTVKFTLVTSNLLTITLQGKEPVKKSSRPNKTKMMTTNDDFLEKYFNILMLLP